MSIDNPVGSQAHKSLSLPQLRWQCRRGMLELDLVLMSFLEKKYDSLAIDEQQQFAALLNFPDPMLYTWLLEKNNPSNLTITLESAELEAEPGCFVTVEGLQKIIKKIREEYILNANDF